MSFPEYLNGIINLHSKHRQVEKIKEQIKKMLPLPTINSQQKQNFIQNHRKLEDRKTVENFFQSSSKKISLSLQTRPLFYSSTQKNFRPAKMEQKESFPARLPHQLYQQNSNEEEESMKEWRQQMLSHIKPQKPIQYKSIQSQSPQTYETKERQVVSPKIFKIKTSPSRLKKKNRALSKPIFSEKKQISQKQIILIKPTPIQEDRAQKNIQKNKYQPLKTKKTMTIDRFFNYNIGSTNNTKQSDELTLQKIANFQALLPFLGTRKAKVQKKEEKKEVLYEVKQSIQQQVKKKRENKAKQVQMREQLTGWQTTYD